MRFGIMLMFLPHTPLMQGWIVQLRFQLLPSQNCGAIPDGPSAARR